jgi:hypothetical protein
MKDAMKAPRALALLFLTSAVLLTARPSLAGEEALEGLSFLDPVPAATTAGSPLDALDLSVVRDGSESTLRVPLAVREDNRPQRRLVPYLAVGASFLTDSSIRDSGVPYEDASRAQRSGMDMGAGLAWKLSNRLELFGEYRFLRMNPDPAGAGGTGILHRDTDGPFLKGGFTIRLP